MRITSPKLVVLVIAILAVLAMAPMASANSFNLTSNNLGVPGIIGTVTTTQNGSNVDVSITMNPGFTILVNGGDLGFFTTGGLVMDANSLTNFSQAGMTASLKSNGGIGSFTFDFLYQTSGSGGQVFLSTLNFTVQNATLSQITGLGLHFACDSTIPTCAPNGSTGFVVTSGSPPPVPEPGTLGLLGTGLVGLAALLRRRFVS